MFAFLTLGFSLFAQTNSENSEWEIRALNPNGSVMFTYDLNTGNATATNGVLVKYMGAVLTADEVSINKSSGKVDAWGNVRIQREDQIWAGEHIIYNFKTHQMISEQFRTGKFPVFAEGRGLSADLTNNVYNATNAFITADDISNPLLKIRAARIRSIPGKRIEATHAVLYIGEVPVFYFPYYTRSLSEHANHFSVLPGYRSRFGPFLLGSYTWYLNDNLDGEFHLDYREKRGVGVGPDFNFHLGRWGDGTFRYYYTHDNDPSTNGLIAPVGNDRQRLIFSYQANPFTNFNVKALARYQSDIGVTHDFFESEYRHDPQPDTFVEANKFWDNFSLDVLAQPRVNNFYETVERLPDVRLTGFRQQIGATPLFYQSENSVGYYRRLFAETNNAPNGLSFEAARADTYHQIILPHTFFGWLNVAPRAGGRFTYYSDATGPGAKTDEEFRGVFNTGAEVSFKASRLWPDVKNKALDLDGLRHIIEPSVNYVYVPSPNVRPHELPQFDYELPSLQMLPIEFPEYNSIDSIDSENVIRFGLGNKLQTRRNGQIDDVLNWQVYTDWRLRPRAGQETFADLYSDLALRPRSWLTLESQTRFDINGDRVRMLLHTMTIQPNTTWSWTIGHFYLRDDFNSSPTALGQGNNLVTSTIFYRLNENWGFRATHHYDLRGGRMEEQYYTAYRDMRSWTAALTAGLRDNRGGSDDFIIAFTFSLKAAPRYALGRDTAEPYSLLGR
ncbi:MAG TPA: LPS assembly protein LptD [Verrucomicrobiae bacterium]|nr:LPS assembly protein LptD [Verrucomicrobiae bacterium]